MAAMSSLPEHADEQASPEDLALLRDDAGQVIALLASLPPAQREIIILRVAMGMSTEETAAALGMTAGAARVAQHRAHTKLRSHYAIIDDETGTVMTNHFASTGSKDDRLLDALAARTYDGADRSAGCCPSPGPATSHRQRRARATAFRPTDRRQHVRHGRVPCLRCERGRCGQRLQAIATTPGRRIEQWWSTLPGYQGPGEVVAVPLGRPPQFLNVDHLSVGSTPRPGSCRPQRP
jgi:hypothetical protein